MNRPCLFHSSANFDIIAVKCLCCIEDLGTCLRSFSVAIKRRSSDPFRSFLATSASMPTSSLPMAVFFGFNSKLLTKIVHSSECLTVIFVRSERIRFLVNSIRTHRWSLIIAKLLIVTKWKESWLLSALKVLLAISWHVGNLAATVFKTLVFVNQVVLKRTDIIILVNFLQILIFSVPWALVSQSSVSKDLSLTLISFFNRI